MSKLKGTDFDFHLFTKNLNHLSRTIPVSMWQYTYTPPSDWPYVHPTRVYTQEAGEWEDGWLVWSRQDRWVDDPCVEDPPTDDDNSSTSGRINDLEDQLAWMTALVIIVSILVVVLLVALVAGGIFMWYKVTRISYGVTLE